MAGDGVRTPKPWYKSKTMWFNIASTGLAIATASPGLIPVNPEVIASGVAIGNILLRFLTNTGVTVKG